MRRVARLSGNVGQPDHILANPIISHKAERRPGPGEIWLAVTTVTFEEKGYKTLLVLHELYPSKEALDGAIAGMEGGMPEQFEQLDELLVTLGASAGRS